LDELGYGVLDFRLELIFATVAKNIQLTLFTLNPLKITVDLSLLDQFSVSQLPVPGLGGLLVGKHG